MRLALAVSLGSALLAGELIDEHGIPSTELVLAVVVVLAAVGGLFALWIAKLAIVVCPPHGVLVLSGRRQAGPDGSIRGFRVVAEGLAVRIPILERAAVLDRTVVHVEGELRNAHTRNGQSWSMRFTACACVAASEPGVSAAVERFLDRDRQELAAVVRECLEGALRRVASAIEPELLWTDRELCSQQIVEEARDDTDRLGLEIRTFHLQEVAPTGGTAR